MATTIFTDMLGSTTREPSRDASIMQLNASIARQIVERAMKIIKYSVNVMDEHGRIIGSGDPSRINERHEGAVLAINDNRVVEIDVATAQQLKGVRPGINLPIMYRNKVIGVVGVSGAPESVYNYGELVKMTAELIVEQAALINEVQWNKRHKEELVQQLVLGSQLTDNQLLSIAERLEMDLAQPRIAAIVKVFPNKGKPLLPEHLQQLVYLLEYPERDNLVGIPSVSTNEVVLLKPIILTETGWSREAETRRVNKLIARIAKEADFTIRIAMGDYFPTLQGLSMSYVSAKATIEASPDSKQNSVLYYQDNILPVLLKGLENDLWRSQVLELPLQNLITNDGNGVLLKTLRAFFDQNCDMAQTCKVLHIHRNTLRYRLEKTNKVTSLNINKISDRTRLYLALLNHPHTH